MIEFVNRLFHFRRETNPVKRVFALKPINRVADFTDFTNFRMRISVFNVYTRLWLGAFYIIKIVIWDVSGMIFDEIVVRIKSSVGDNLAGLIEERTPLILRHIQVDRFEQPPPNESAAKIAERGIRRA